MAIYLVQHGAAKAEAEDPERGLTDEGRRTVERVGEHLAKCNVALGPGSAPNDDVEPTCARLNDETTNVMLVGHLPHLSRLTSRLLGLERDQTLVRFQMSGVVKLDRDGAGRWVLCWIFTPELLPR